MIKKLYISADMEGISGTTVWDEVYKDKPVYLEFAEQMTTEVAIACEAALELGVGEIWVKDAHATGRNIIAEKLPAQVKLIRGWSGHPYSMMQEIDSTFDAAIMIGYHASDHDAANPLSHTLTGKTVYTKINDRYASEFLINTYTAALNQVPVVMLSGDESICREAEEVQPEIETIAVKKGVGASTININPNEVRKLLGETVRKALQKDPQRSKLNLPKRFNVEIRYKTHDLAYHSGFYPGVKTKDPYTITYQSDDFFEILTMFKFTG